MMPTVNDLVAAANASYYSNLATGRLQKASTQLASGSRLSTLQDAAGLAVSAKLGAVTARLGAASEGAQNLISFSQTSSGVLGNVSKGLSRLGELAIRATDGTLTDADRATLNVEYTQLRDSLSTQIDSATFNGTSLFDDTQTVSTSINETGTQFQLNIPDAAGDISGLLGTDISTSANAKGALDLINQATENISSSSAQVNADISSLNSYIQNIETANVNVANANSRLSDVDFGQASVENTRASILQQASIALTAQANLRSQNVLRLLG